MPRPSRFEKSALFCQRRALLLFISVLFAATWNGRSHSAQAAGPPSRQTREFSAKRRQALEDREAALRSGIDEVPPLARTRAIEEINEAVPEIGIGASWTSIGPAGIQNGSGMTTNGRCDPTNNTRVKPSRINVAGRVASLAFAAGNSTVYVGTANGGVWKGVGNSLKPLTDTQDIPSLAIGAIAVVPQNNTANDIVYAGTGEGNTSCDTEFGQGILKSTKGGAPGSWMQLAAATFDRQAFTKIAIPFDPITPDDPTVLYATTTFGVSGAASANCPSVTTGTTGLYQSTNNGVAWALLSGGVLPPAGGSNNMPTGSGTDVVTPASLPLKATAWMGTNVDMGGGGCPGMATNSLDTNPMHQSIINVTKDPFSGFDFSGSLWLIQTPAAGVHPPGICDDYAGPYTCSGMAATMSGGMTTFTCIGGNSGATLNSMGTFNLNHLGVGTFSGTWTLSASTGPDVVKDGTFTWKGLPTVYSGIANSGVWRSTDAGATWTMIGSGAGNGRYALDVSPDAKTVYIGAANTAANPQTLSIFQSTDYGNTFSAGAVIAGNAPPGVTNAALCQSEQQMDYDLALAMDPNTPNTVYLGLTALYASFDGGMTFSFVGNGAHVDQHALKINQVAAVFAGNDGGLYSEAEGDPAWTTQNATLGNLQFQGIGLPPTGAAQVIGGTQDNGTNVYSGMVSWQHAIDADGGWGLVDPANTMIVFGEQQNLSLQRSSMGGALGMCVGGTSPGDVCTIDNNCSGGGICSGGFTRISPMAAAGNQISFFAPITQDPQNPDRILLGTDHVWESCSGMPRVCNGTSADQAHINWQAIAGQNLTMSGATAACAGNSCDISDLAIAPTDSNVLYVVTSSEVNQFNSGMHPAFAWVSRNSTDAGPMFTNITAGLPGTRVLTSIAISPINPAEAIVTSSGFGGGHVWHTSNFGANWADIGTGHGFPDIPAISVIIDRASPLDTYMVGTDTGVLRTTNGGNSWVGFNQNSLPMVPVYQMRQNADIIAAATHGRGVWTITNPTPLALTIKTPTIKFSPLKLGKTSKSKKATLRNGNVDGLPISFGQITLTGTNPADYGIAANTCTGKLQPSKSCAVSVTFSPHAMGASSATMRVVDNANNTPQLIQLSGDGK